MHKCTTRKGKKESNKNIKNKTRDKMADSDEHQQDKYDTIMRAFDLDGDKRLSRDEFQRLFNLTPEDELTRMSQLMVNLGPNETAGDMVFRVTDEDGDNKISTDEIRRFDRYMKDDSDDDDNNDDPKMPNAVSYGVYVVLGILLLAVLFAFFSSRRG